MNGIEIGNGLALRDGATFRGDVSLVGAKVGGYLNGSGATFAAGLDMDSLEVGKSLFLRGGATFKGDVNLLSARVGGSLDAGGATFAGALGMEDIEVARNLYLRNGAAFEGGIYASGARVGADIALNNAFFGADVDLTNAKAGGDLRLGSSTHERARWGSNARLLPRNAGFGAVQDRLDTEPDGSRLDAWPGRGALELSGLTYERLGGFQGEGPSDMMARPSWWYIGWLARVTSYSPQPYQQLAKVFRDAGANKNANDVLYAARERERSEADGLRWIGLSLLKTTIGYGLGVGYFRALLWIAAFTLVGTLFSGRAVRKRELAACTGALGPASTRSCLWSNSTRGTRHSSTPNWRVGGAHTSTPIELPPTCLAPSWSRV